MRIRRVMGSFAAVVCPPEVAEPGRLDATLGELDLMLAAFGPAAARMVPVLFTVIDQGARLYPACRGRPLRTAHQGAAAGYLGALLRWPGAAGELVRRLKSLVVMCYYELPEVKQEIGYVPEPYIAAVTRRRRERYGPELEP